MKGNLRYNFSVYLNNKLELEILKIIYVSTHFTNKS